MNEELKEQIRELIIEVLEEREKDTKECERAFDEMMLKDVPPFPSINQELRYNKSMPDEKKTDFEKLQEERAAATLLRDEISFIVGFTKASNPEISEGLEKALKMHEKARCQDWL